MIPALFQTVSADLDAQLGVIARATRRGLDKIATAFVIETSIATASTIIGEVAPNCEKSRTLLDLAAMAKAQLHRKLSSIHPRALEIHDKLRSGHEPNIEELDSILLQIGEYRGFATDKIVDKLVEMRATQSGIDIGELSGHVTMSSKLLYSLGSRVSWTRFLDYLISIKSFPSRYRISFQELADTFAESISFEAKRKNIYSLELIDVKVEKYIEILSGARELNEDVGSLLAAVAVWSAIFESERVEAPAQWKKLWNLAEPWYKRLRVHLSSSNAPVNPKVFKKESSITAFAAVGDPIFEQFYGEGEVARLISLESAMVFVASHQDQGLTTAQMAEAHALQRELLAEMRLRDSLRFADEDVELRDFKGILSAVQFRGLRDEHHAVFFLLRRAVKLFQKFSTAKNAELLEFLTDPRWLFLACSEMFDLPTLELVDLKGVRYSIDRFVRRNLVKYQEVMESQFPDEPDSQRAAVKLMMMMGVANAGKGAMPMLVDALDKKL